MRLLIIQETDWLKRNPAQQHHLAEMLSLRGHEVRAIDFPLLWREEGRRGLYSRGTVFPDVSKIHQNARVTVIRPGMVRVPWVDYVSLVFSHRKEIRRQITEFAPQVIVGFGILNSYLAAGAARRNNIPFIYYWIDVLHRLIPFDLFRPIGRWAESKVLKQADRVLAINEKLKEYVIGLGAERSKTSVLGAGIDTGRFDPGASDGNSVREQMGIKSGDTVLFFMGWLYHFSGLKEVALEVAKRQDPGLKLVIVGEGDAYEELRQIRDRYNLPDRIVLTGKKPYQEIPALVAAADICLLPAYPWEPIMQDIVPIKMYEYMAMKKAVIATRLLGVVKEFGENNGVVYVDQPEGAVAKATELAHNKRLQELGQRARDFVVKHSWESITDRFEKILEETVEEKRNERAAKPV